MHRRLKLGLIGGGTNSAIGTTHMSAAELDRRFEIVGGCFSRDPAVVAGTCERWRLDPSACDTDWRRYLDTHHASLDAIAVLTPIPDHLEHVSAALALGVPVISEKALVASVSEATELFRRVGRQRHFLATTLNYSGYPLVRRLRSLVRDGAFGTLRQVHLEMPLENYLRIPTGAETAPAPQAWRQRDGEIPMLLLDLGVHLHHLLAFVTGSEPARVMADLRHQSSVGDVIDDARLWIDGRDGLQATCWMSKVALGHRNGLRLRLYGDRGSAEWYQCEPETLHLTDARGRRRELSRGEDDALLDEPRYNRFKAGHPSGYIEAFANLYHDIADALEDWQAERPSGDAYMGVNGHPYVYGLEHSEVGLRTLDAAVRSAQGGHWVDIARPERALLRVA